MAESHVVSGLVEKRSELSGQIEHYRKEMARLTEDLNHVDATIKLFSPEFDLRTVRAKAHRQRNQLFKQGECQRTVLEIFREAAGRAISSRHIAEQIMARKGVEQSEGMLAQMQRSVRRLENSATLQAAGREGQAQSWRLV